MRGPEPGPINIRPPFIEGICQKVLASLIDPTIPHNFGLSRAVECRFREGSIVNPSFPAPTGFYSKNLRSVEGAVFTALSQAAGMPTVSFSGTQSSMVIGSTAGSARPYVQYEIFNPGSYAFDGGDGITGTATALAAAPGSPALRSWNQSSTWSSSSFESSRTRREPEGSGEDRATSASTW